MRLRLITVLVFLASACGPAAALDCPPARPAALTLTATLERGLCLDSRLAEQAAEWARSRGAVDEAAAATGWQSSLQASPAWSGQHGGGTDTNSGTGSASINVSRVLADGGLTRARTSQREREAHAARAALETTRQDVLRELAAAWSDAREARAAVSATRRALGAAQSSDAAARARLASGTATRVDALSATAALAQAERELLGAEVGWRRRQVVLTQRLGWPADTALDLVASESGWLAALADDIGAGPSTSALDTHPQLLAQRERVNARRAALDAARAEDGATLSLSGLTGPKLTRSNVALPGNYETSRRWASEIALTWSMPLSDGGARQSRRVQGQAALDGVLAEQATLERSLHEALWQQWTAWQASDGELRAAQAALDAARAAEGAQRGRYEAGAGTLTDWINAQSDLSARERQAASAEQSRLRAAVGTAHALGRLHLPEAP